MKNTIIISLKALILLSVLTGVLYPLLVTVVAEAIFPHQAEGSLISGRKGPLGSALLGQEFRSNRYFWGRPSAAGYTTMPFGGSNLGPTSSVLQDSVSRRKVRFLSMNGLPVETSVPREMLTTSASGVDPHISPAAARLQAARVARARGWTGERERTLLELVERSVEGPQYGLFGEPRVNVLRLNLATDSLDGFSGGDLLYSGNCRDRFR